MAVETAPLIPRRPNQFTIMVVVLWMDKLEKLIAHRDRPCRIDAEDPKRFR